MLKLARLVRDQANKCFDVYLQRIRKYGNTLPDTAMPPPAVAAASGAAPRMGTPQNDAAGWTGWAISSFTNKLATASGDMQSKYSNQNPPKLDRSSSVPPTTDSSRAPPTSSSTSDLHRQALTSISTAAQAPTPQEKFFAKAQDEDGEIDDAWGEIAEDSFFDAPSEAKPSAPAPVVAFDDGGEPDFEGWLKAQQQAKLKAPLPKGLVKSSTQPDGRASIMRTTTTGSFGSGTGAQKLANAAAKPKTPPAKVVSTKPREADDEWGDAWD